MSTASAHDPPVEYTVSIKSPWTHALDVTMQIPLHPKGDRGRKVTLCMPVWTPGSYMVRDFARNVLSLEVRDQDDRAVPVEKVTKSSWVVDAPETATKLVVHYRVYAFAFGTGTSYVDVDHAVLNGASVFLFADDMQSRPALVHLEPHPSWKVVSTGLDSLPDDVWTLRAHDYDALVDSPIEVGNQHVHSFHALEAKHEVSIFSLRPVDELTLVNDLKKIVESTVPIFGEVPYKRYVFLIDLVGDGYGGLEHANSTLCIGSYFALEPPEEYRSFLTLFSHEFFHTWNVKRMRPAALGPFNYLAENYTRSLWVAEGLTSYYEDVILRRAGLFSVAEFLDDLVSAVNFLRALPSSRVQTPEESSFDSWVRYYKQDENSPNVSPSYYRQGTVLGLLLDLVIRNASESSHSLDDVMREVYRGTYVAEHRGFTDEEFQRACGLASLGQTDEIFSRYVRGREEVDYDKYLDYIGLQLTPKTPPNEDEGFLGVRVRAGPGLNVITRLTGSAAERADISAGDEIIATDGLRTDAGKLGYYIANRKPGTKVQLTIARGGVLKTVEAVLGKRPVFDYRFTKKPSATDSQKQTFAAWAIGNWDDPLVYKDRRQSPATQRTLDYV